MTPSLTEVEAELAPGFGLGKPVCCGRKSEAATAGKRSREVFSGRKGLESVGKRLRGANNRGRVHEGPGARGAGKSWTEAAKGRDRRPHGNRE